MKIIFLDIDGVLNSKAYDAQRNWNEQTDIDETRLPLVKKLAEETGAKIVLSSTWREHWDKVPEKCDEDGVYINEAFAKFGLEIYDKTPDLGISANRPDEIKAWLDSTKETIEKFVIIDDYRYGWGSLSDNFVKTNPYFGLGLEEEHVQKAIEILISDRKCNNNLKCKISILGDSISTYQGFNPPYYPVYYKDDNAYENDILSVNDTWWKQVIDAVDGELCENNSYSGSLVFGNVSSSACSEERCTSLHGTNIPDVILIYMGTNDRGYGIEIQKFYDAYCTMLRRIKKKYPDAKIICATLLLGYYKNGEGKLNAESVVAEFEYNNAIRAAVKDENCLLADIASSGKCYETLDDCHPTKSGHSLIAKLWFEKLKSLLK